MLAQRTRDLKTVIELLEQNPRKWFTLALASVGNCADSDSYLLMARILEDLHPTARAQCKRIARERDIFFA